MRWLGPLLVVALGVAIVFAAPMIGAYDGTGTWEALSLFGGGVLAILGSWWFVRVVRPNGRKNSGSTPRDIREP